MIIQLLAVIKTKQAQNNMEYENILKILHSSGIINEYDSISDYLINNDLERLKIDFDNCINYNSQLNQYFLIIILFVFSEACYNEITTSKNTEVKFKGKILREHIDDKIISLTSDKIFLFFKWDLERRVFGGEKSNFELDYLKKSVLNLSDELNGNSDDTLEKYVLLFIDFIEEYFKKLLSQQNFINEMRENEFLKETNPFELLNMFDVVKGAANEGFDSKVKDEFSENYKPLAKKRLEGLMNTRGRYNHFYLSFIEAQVKHHSYLEKIINSFHSINNLKALCRF